MGKVLKFFESRGFSGKYLTLIYFIYLILIAIFVISGGLLWVFVEIKVLKLTGKWRVLEGLFFVFPVSVGSLCIGRFCGYLYCKLFLIQKIINKGENLDKIKKTIDCRFEECQEIGSVVSLLSGTGSFLLSIGILLVAEDLEILFPISFIFVVAFTFYFLNFCERRNIFD